MSDDVISQNISRLNYVADEMDKLVDAICKKLDEEGLPSPGEVKEDGTVSPPQLNPPDFSALVAQMNKVQSCYGELRSIINKMGLGPLSRQTTPLTKEGNGPRSMMSVGMAGIMDSQSLKKQMEEISQLCQRLHSTQFPKRNPTESTSESEKRVGDFLFSVPEEKRQRKTAQQVKDG